MSDHLDHAAAIVGGCCAHCDDLVDERLALLDEAGLLATPERDAQVRADERGRCSVIHATLTDDALVAELVRRGVLREVEAECDDEVETGHCHDRMHWSYCDMSQTRVEVRRGLYERRDLAMGEDE